MCNHTPSIELYPATGGIAKARASPMPPNIPHNANVVWKVQMPGQVVMSNLQ